MNIERKMGNTTNPRLQEQAGITPQCRRPDGPCSEQLRKVRRQMIWEMNGTQQPTKMPNKGDDCHNTCYRRQKQQRASHKTNALYRFSMLYSFGRGDWI